MCSYVYSFFIKKESADLKERQGESERLTSDKLELHTELHSGACAKLGTSWLHAYYLPPQNGKKLVSLCFFK